MRILPSEKRPSTQLLRELLKIRADILEVEKSNTPYIKNLDPLLKKDFWISTALIRFLKYELNLNIEFPDDVSEEDISEEETWEKEVF